MNYSTPAVPILLVDVESFAEAPHDATEVAPGVVEPNHTAWRPCQMPMKSVESPVELAIRLLEFLMSCKPMGRLS